MEANDPRARSVQRILLAEDDEDMRRFLVKALEKAGYAVVSFGNGVEAYERLILDAMRGEVPSLSSLKKPLCALVPPS